MFWALLGMFLLGGGAGVSGGMLTSAGVKQMSERERLIQEDLNSSWKVAQQRALDLRFELKESMTEEEWTALFSTE